MRSPRLPTWAAIHGWRGGEKDRVYAFTDARTGRTSYFTRRHFWRVGAGPDHVAVRPALLSEVERLTDEAGPLFPKAGQRGGWKVVDDGGAA